MRWTKYFLLALITLSLTISESCGVNYKSTLLNSTAVVQTVNNCKAEADRLFKRDLEQARTKSQFQQALQSWQQSLAIYREIGDRYREGATLDLIGNAYGSLGDYPKAIGYFEQALKIGKEIGNRGGIASSLRNLGIAYSSLGDYPKAIDYHQQSLIIFKKIGNPSGIANSLANLGDAYYGLGNYPKAINYHQQSLEISQQIPYPKGAANSLNSLGSVYDKLGNYRKAIDYHKQSLKISQKIQNRPGIANSLGNLGNAYDSLGDYRTAIKCHEQSLTIKKQISNRSGVANSLNNLGVVYYNLGNYSKAIKYHEQSLIINQQISNSLGIADSLNNLGNAYYSLRDYPKAIDCYQRSLKINQQIQNRWGIANSLINLGNTYYSLKGYPKAIDYQQQALKINQQIQNRWGIANSLGNLGNAYDGLGNYRKAIDYYQQSLVIFKEIGNPSGIANSLNNLGGAYQELEEYESAKENLYQAIAIWEDIRKMLLNRDSDKISIFEQQARTYLLLQEVLVAQNQPLQALEISERGRNRALVEILWRQLSQIPEKKLIPPTPNLTEIQQIAQQQNATLVQYSIVYDNQLYIWVIPPQGKIKFRNVPLPKDIPLKQLVKITREKQLNARGRNSNNSPVKQENCTDCLKQLHQLLIKPIADLLPNNEQQRVIFIPHQELFSVPFVALQNEENKYLIEKHTILTAPSIQALDLSQQNKRVQKNSSANIFPGNQSLIVGNPTMPKDKVGKDSKPLKQLPGAEEEAKNIAQMLGTKAIIGNQATESAIVEKMASAKLIHLATHGLLDGTNAIGSPGAIALARDVNNDGFLTTSEIMERFGLPGKSRLQADLVVLSACDTGRGDIKAEGIIGLSRAFIASGVPTLVVSLWKVPDDATTSLMTKFYKNIYKGKFDKATAMREAMLTMINDDDPDPKNWAAFTVIGKAE
ncbi:MAG: tetratricopeptide repeat protein [Scytonema sp. PMC 1070.18]|nr:tetratricopeptide repeat protein [Scytonema sp. PMC 1070.18]